MGRTEFLTATIASEPMVGKRNPSTRAKWRSSPGAGSNAPKQALDRADTFIDRTLPGFAVGAGVYFRRFSLEPTNEEESFVPSLLRIRGLPVANIEQEGLFLFLPRHAGVETRHAVRPISIPTRKIQLPHNLRIIGLGDLHDLRGIGAERISHIKFYVPVA